MRPIDTEADLAEGLAALLAADQRLVPVAAAAGAIPLRRRPGGFEGLAAVITAQQISAQAAESIWRRFRAAVDPFTPEGVLEAGEDVLRKAGLSRPKITTLTGTAAACRDGFVVDHLHALPAEDAVAAMTALKGIGPWTAESYLLFCAGHPDVFPAGDLALRSAVHEGLGLRDRPDEGRLRKLAEQWSPWRAVAARLFWTYYRARRDLRRARSVAAPVPL
jgi:DNA-3-methyladenine glycosylase II